MEIVAKGGYPAARVGDIASQAGVSRATFYELFENKEACFLAAHRELGHTLDDVVTSSVAKAKPERAIDAAFSAMVEFAREQPLAYDFLTHEAMLAGPDALEERDRLLARLEERVEQAHAVAGKRASLLPDVPASILLGGLVRVLGMRMRRGQYDSAQLLSEMTAWVDCYRPPRRSAAPPREFAMDELEQEDQGVSPGAMAPAPLPRGRHRLPTALVTRVQRERILHATAEAIYAKGYEDTTVADIVAKAGLSREVFYSHFHSRSDAFIATHKLVFEQMMATAAGAFISSSGAWPERVWDSWSAATGLVVGTPSLAHFAFVESYALGPSIAQRTDDAIVAFTVFLRDGQRYGPDGAEPSASVSTAIAGAVMETTSSYIRRERAGELFVLLPLMVYMILAPFLGGDEAREFVDGKLREPRQEG
ncbi:MAG TPA: TetR/AcrR family transcriptional regulator [Solirubrobacteraceae bacterium]|nr:TetR/AcrR family transcriptional regulator [Solirubrobacteraceae bacterium]